jgi:hypothetical protein
VDALASIGANPEGSKRTCANAHTRALGKVVREPGRAHPEPVFRRRPRWERQVVVIREVLGDRGKENVETRT